MDEGIPDVYKPLGTQGGASTRFTDRRGFEVKRGEVYSPSHFSIS